MHTQITLEYFHAKQRHYHIYPLSDSIVAERPHSHDYFQVCYVIKGQLAHSVQDKTVQLGQGDVFIIPPGVTHRIAFVGKHTQIDSLCFTEQLFSPGFPQSHAYQFLLKLQTWDSAQPVRLRLEPDEEQRKTIRCLLQSISREQEAAWPRQLTAAASLVSALLCVLAQCYYQQPHNRQAYQQLDENREIMEGCIAYIDAHYTQSLAQKELLRIFGLSRSAFSAMFPRYTGLSLKQYINQKRITRAQELLREQPKLSLQQVADRVGYGEISTFYRNFVQITGVPPSQYRAIYR